MRGHANETGAVQVTRRPTQGKGGARTRGLWEMLDRDFTEPLPILAFLIEHPDGLILVDTGEVARASAGGWFPRWHPYFRLAVRMDVRPEQEIAPQVRALGFALGDVRTVVLTHMH